MRQRRKGEGTDNPLWFPLVLTERLVGVNSGGMDQSASVFSLPLHLLHMYVITSLIRSSRSWTLKTYSLDDFFL